MADRNNRRFSQGNGVIAAAIVIAALIISWGAPSSQPRFQLAASGNAVVRLDTDSGAMLACDLQQCRQIEAPLRAKTFGPLKVVVGKVENNVERQQEPKQLPANNQ
jgi:hypothetical protein